ncbi:NUMOD4 domain-containing protein [Massilia pseudoviolaceinigra]|uniref:NUMOD4 domain-containing protein n=1 Tax=Massilia pseudoviolaceinigra TaxID=3057165 RepID=UPI002796A4D6|nr:NUMOD4 domain-containing protein [Massilia sp. CCM 9206]MDQ1921628.1 NUMOD4 domain-containing protein [Massilia sp. CCM 9206]
MQEIWRPVVGFDGLYEVSNCGKVQSNARYARIRGGGKRLLKPVVLKHWESNSGYQMVQLSVENCTTKHYVHRLVAMAFVPNPHHHLEVNHIDCVKRNNVQSNLEWVSRQENEDHKVSSGRTVRGELNCRAKLTSVEVAEIRLLLASGVAQASIARKYAVGQSTICRIKTGESWGPEIVSTPACKLHAP